jgi:hypothetical protein
MLRKGLSILVMALLAAPLFADVELSTSISDVFNRGTSELAGSITMRVNDDDFNDASTSEPVYIRVTLDHEASLAQTLVSLEGTGTAYFNNPIYLATRVNASSAGFFNNVSDPQTVSIVRWVEGENQIWLRVQTSSQDWITDTGVAVPPRGNLTFSWVFGISARRTFESNENLPFGTGNADVLNLPYNTRNLGNAGLEEDAVSTLICTDLSSSSLTTSGVESLLNYDPIAFDEDADVTDSNDEGNPSYGFFRPSNDTGITFTNDFSIARGRARDCTVGIGDKGAFVVQDLCVPRAGLNASLDGFIWINNTINFIVDCERGGEFLDTDLFNGSFITFTTGNRGLFGFEDGGAEFLNGASFDIVDGAFEDNGETLYNTVDLVWNGGFQTLDDFEFQASVDVHYHFSNGPVDVTLNWEVTLVNNEGAADVAPFDALVDQDIRCPPSQFVIDAGLWEYGAFVECTGADTVIFFPYLPQLVGNDLFWSGLAVVNQGQIDLDVEAVLYGEEGTRYTGDFGSIAVNNQRTWLLIDGDQGPGFYGTGSVDGQFVAPQPSDPSVDPASFGTTRMSMFVIGSFDATFDDEIFIGDIDGYLLIGREGDIDGAYLPRNYDNSIPNQNADLPINRSKVARTGTTVNPHSVELLAQEQPAKYEFRNGKHINKRRNK